MGTMPKNANYIPQKRKNMEKLTEMNQNIFIEQIIMDTQPSKMPIFK